MGESLDELAALADELRATAPPDALRTWAAALLGHVARYRGLATSLATASGDPLAGRCTATERAFARLVEHVREKEQLRAGVTATAITRLATAVAWAAEARASRSPPSACSTWCSTDSGTRPPSGGRDLGGRR